MILVLCVPRIQVCNSHPTDEPNLAVHHENFPVSPLIQSVEIIPAERVILHDLDPGPAHLVEQRVPPPLRTEPVQDDMGRHSRAGPLGEGIGESLSDLSRPEDVALEVDASFRRADRIEHCWKRLVSIEKCGDAVPAHNRWAEQVAERSSELGVTGGVAMRDRVLDRFVGAGEVGIEEEGDQCHHHNSRRPGSPARSELQTHWLGELSLRSE